MLPTALQARKVIWDGIDKKGRRMIDQAFPPDVRKRKNDTEMKIELLNGSIWQCVGSDNYDSLVGSNPIGVVFSEYSIANPAAWDYIRPILAENGGWAVFIYTPRGKGPGYQLYKMALQNDDWFCQKLTVDDTKVLPEGTVEAERQAGMSEAMIQQEFYTSFDVPVEGAYYADQINNAYKQNRITRVPIEPALPVYTFWDLGIGDATAIWFAQAVGKEIRIINAYQNNNEGMVHYIHKLKEFAKDNNIRYGGEVRELMSGKSRKQTAREMGINFKTVKRHSIEEGIEALRRLFPRFWIDQERCEDGLSALAAYTKQFDDKNMVWSNRPLHNWASHYADAARCMAMAWRDTFSGERRFDKPHVASTDLSIF
jgi:hypothetical protein